MLGSRCKDRRGSDISDVEIDDSGLRVEKSARCRVKDVEIDAVQG